MDEDWTQDDLRESVRAMESWLRARIKEEPDEARRQSHEGLLDLIWAEVVDDVWAQVPRLMLENLALYYQDHPGYRDEWRRS